MTAHKRDAASVRDDDLPRCASCGHNHIEWPSGPGVCPMIGCSCKVWVDPKRDAAPIRRFVRRPFKGAFFYEWQIGPVVFQVKRRDIQWPDVPNPLAWFHVWTDPYWREA